VLLRLTIFHGVELPGFDIYEHGKTGTRRDAHLLCHRIRETGSCKGRTAGLSCCVSSKLTRGSISPTRGFPRQLRRNRRCQNDEPSFQNPFPMLSQYALQAGSQLNFCSSSAWFQLFFSSSSACLRVLNAGLYLTPGAFKDPVAIGRHTRVMDTQAIQDVNCLLFNSHVRLDRRVSVQACL
jgi:hypothetical protein